MPSLNDLSAIKLCRWAQGCKREAEPGLDGFCERHFTRSIWLNNRDKRNLGILTFARNVVPSWLRNKTPEFHEDMFYEYMQLYSSRKTDKYDRLLAEVAFRGAAKTTRTKIILLYVCCEGLEPFVIYCSETNALAVQDVMEVRRELSTNPFIKRYYGQINSKRTKGSDGEWSRDAFLTSTGVYVLARGVGQQIRSALRGSYRPTLALINDIYSKASVKTEHSRSETAKWFWSDMFNAIDDIEGKVFFNGTILHEDTVPVIVKKSDLWKTLETPIMEYNDFQTALKSCIITETNVTLPSLKKIDELQARSKLYWQDRLNLKYILKKYKEAYESNAYSSANLIAEFYQEYFHVVISEEEKTLKPIQIVPIKFFKVRGYSFISVKFGDKEVTYQVNTFAGVDPASAITSTAKYSAIPVIAMNKDRQIFVIHVSRGKFGIRDELKPGIDRGNGDIVWRERSDLARIGNADEVIRLKKEFNLNGTKIETTQAQENIYNEVLRLIPKNNAFHSIFSEKPTTEKIERDGDILASHFQTRNIFINIGLDALVSELEAFPRGATVDIIDGLAHAVSIARPAEGIELKDGKLYKQKEEDLETNFFVL